MASDVRSVIDPLGNEIILLHEITLHPGDDDETYDDPEMVISKPAMLFEVRRENKKQMFYFRYIGGDSTLLILVDYKNNRWETTESIKNPTTEMLSKIMKSGKQLL